MLTKKKPKLRWIKSIESENAEALTLHGLGMAEVSIHDSGHPVLWGATFCKRLRLPMIEDNNKAVVKRACKLLVEAMLRGKS